MKEGCLSLTTDVVDLLPDGGKAGWERGWELDHRKKLMESSGIFRFDEEP
jgi:hypothetical protein